MMLHLGEFQTMNVYIVEYDPAWEQLFLEESKLFQAILQDNCVAIHHIGSTSVPGLAAKPVIDMMPVVKSLAQVDQVAGEFEKLGYEVLGEFGIPGRRYMRKGGENRTHQVHFFSESDQENIHRHLAFRDYLKANPEVAEAYAALKRELAQKYPRDIIAYNMGKNDFIQGIEAKLREKWLHAGPGE